MLDRGIWSLNDSAFVLYGEEDEACTKADDVTGQIGRQFMVAVAPKVAATWAIALTVEKGLGNGAVMTMLEGVADLAVMGAVGEMIASSVV